MGKDLKAYQAEMDWMGERVLTLQDVWPEEPRAMIVGLNPAPASVEAGHYYQGRSGQRQLLRLADGGLFERPSADEVGFEAAALRAQVGFTDVIKRPTRGELGIRIGEVDFGREALIRALESRRVPLVVCVFRQPVQALLGVSGSPGFQTLTTSWGARVFRMPGPFAAAEEAKDVLAEFSRALATN
ncbi:uracil-DNA glycosylase family protein [Nocardioides sp. NPDC101246]|uniref:uracil-DNA glycosylase family protein n=1 Tax=Nocardioides sp. NPDC101246 TaxID=3364336 RepID=UPI0037FFEBA2